MPPETSVSDQDNLSIDSNGKIHNINLYSKKFEDYLSSQLSIKESKHQELLYVHSRQIKEDVQDLKEGHGKRSTHTLSVLPHQ